MGGPVTQRASGAKSWKNVLCIGHQFTYAREWGEGQCDQKEGSMN